MEPRSPTRENSLGVGDHLTVHNYHPEEVASCLSNSATDAGAHGAPNFGYRLRDHEPSRVYPVAHRSSVSATVCPAAVSGRMSIRQPVSRAANRAFCPSRPIARDS
jgi:hypothetical protein